MAVIFDGRQLARKKEKKLKTEIGKLKIKPKLVSIVVGDNPVAHLFVSLKEKAAKRVGILFEKKEFQTKTDPSIIMEFIRLANKDSSISGIIVQLPLPERFRISNFEFRILGSINPQKDVDCLTPENLGRLMMGRPRFLPATVKAVMEIIKSSKLKVKSSNVVIVGASNLVGKPLAIHLQNLGATVTICDEFTRNLGEQTKKAAILISATGVPRLIKGKVVKKGAVVIDVGAPKGDIEFTEVRKVASVITPVPGGVGPLTVVSLLENVLLAAKEKTIKSSGDQ